MNVREATDPRHVSIFSEVRRQWRQQLEQGRFYAEGEQVMIRLLRSKLEIVSMLITREYFEQWKDLIFLRNDPTASIWIAEKRWMEENTGQKLNQGCVAIGKIPAVPNLKDLIVRQTGGGSETRPHKTSRCCFVALDGIDHAVNVGAIVRNCAAFGVTALLLDARSIHPYCWRSIRTSLGSVFHVPVVMADSLIETLLHLKDQKIDLIAADPAGGQTITETDFSKSCCLIFGNEHEGISKSILDLASVRVAIPLRENIDSLNVASASAIFLHHTRVTTGI